MARISRRLAACSPPRRRRIRGVKGDFVERGVKVVREFKEFKEFMEFKEFKEFMEFKEFSGLCLYHP